MFENLSEKLQRAFKALRGEAVLNADNIQEALREIRLALLEADVNFKVVKQLIDHMQEKAVGQEVMTALSPTQQIGVSPPASAARSLRLTTSSFSPK